MLNRFIKRFIILLVCAYSLVAFTIHIIGYYNRDEPVRREIIFNKYLIPNNDIKSDENFLKDILITIKSTQKYHNTRIPDIVTTWYKYAKNQIYVVSDEFDSNINNELDGKLIKTRCGKKRYGLCCKTGKQLELYFKLKKNFKWFCQFDDDNYVNIPNLIELLKGYDHNKFHYLGKNSWPRQVHRRKPLKLVGKEGIKFWFATFGAGICLSNATMYEIKNYSTPKSYKAHCNNYGLPDDTCMGILLETYKNISLTKIPTMNHHLDPLQFKNMSSISEQVTLSFGKTYKEFYDEECNCTRKLNNLPPVKNLYGFENDLLFMKTTHCMIFPNDNDCKLRIIYALSKF